MRPDDDLTARITALELAVADADDACYDADYLAPDEDPGLEIFFAAVDRLKKLEAELAALWRKVAGDRFVHAGNWRRH